MVKFDNVIEFRHLEKYNITKYGVYGSPIGIQDDMRDFYTIGGFKSLKTNSFIRFNFMASVLFADTHIYNNLVFLSKKEFDEYITFFKHIFEFKWYKRHIKIYAGVRKGEKYNEKELYNIFRDYINDKIKNEMRKIYKYRKKITMLNKKLKLIIKKRSKKIERLKFVNTIKAYKKHIADAYKQMEVYQTLKLDRYQYHLIKRLMYDQFFYYNIDYSKAKQLLDFIYPQMDEEKKEKNRKKHFSIMSYMPEVSIYTNYVLMIEPDEELYYFKPEQLIYYSESELDVIILHEEIYNFLLRVSEIKGRKPYLRFVKLYDLYEHKLEKEKTYKKDEQTLLKFE